MTSVKWLACAAVAGVLASCGGIEKRGKPAASGGAGSGGTSATGGSVDHTGGAIADTGGTPAVGTGGISGVDTGGTTSVDAASTGGRATGGSANGTDASVDLCALHGAPCCVPAIADVKPGSGCTVEIFAGYLGTTYEYATLEEKVAALSPDIAVTVTDADVSSAAAAPPPAEKMQFVLTPDASTRLGSSLVEMNYHPFQLSCGGQKLFVGVVYQREGAAALRTPVLHVKREEDGSVVLSLGAWQGAWMGLGSPDDTSAQERIDRPELRAALCENGALRELD